MKLFDIQAHRRPFLGVIMPVSKKHLGVYRVEGKTGVSFGISYTHPQTGQRIRKIVREVTSEAQAAEARAIEIADAKRGALNKAYGLHDKGKPVLFEDMAKLYLSDWSAQNKNYRTDKHRVGALTSFFKGKLMSDITSWHVTQFKSSKAKEVSKNTVNKYLSLGSQIYVMAKKWDKYKGDNPFLEAGRYKIPKPKKPGCLNPEQVAAIMAEIKHPVKRDMVEFAYNTGWRISEIIGLKWADVDLDKATAWLVDTKNRNTVEIQLSDAAVAIIRRQQKNGEHVFCFKNGQPFKTGIPTVFIQAAKRAGVPLPQRRAWHILRRTWATMFLQAGGDVETLRQLGNWKDHKMPLWYAEAADSKLKQNILNKIPQPKLSGRNLAETPKSNKSST
jgi:integrase